ncbi:MAG TPA: Na/Pi cotransporter family protein [Candidatus Dorea gallistercoris]|uniref:Na/Pi cotransporter family protein n=1 Tax=Candidatus Dorea gallistercoris TaxID=2838542 RepID=A0A9D1UCM8_9FIRM|nr:Na/Pi cotransporter family protein [Candidatus Dorea gallistercoris]
MKTTDILMLLGGLALFLYGMQMMSNGLETAAGNRMKQILERLTSNRIKGVLVGAIITAVIQSSSATTVMVVGFVNTGLMTLNQAVWVIMGANIGTTITGQLIALDIGAIAPLIAFIGVACIMFLKNEKARHISSIFAGLGVLFIGMDMMGEAMMPLRESDTFIHFMTTFSNPLIGIAIGAIFTALIQSSSASVGILQALAATGTIPLSSAVFILFGQNIGTCITAVLAAIGTRPNAKRTTIIHLMFNIIGTIIFTIISLTTPFVSLMEGITPDPVAQIANVHTTFNIVTTLTLLPFGTYMAKLATKILPESEEEIEQVKRLKYIVPFESNYPVGHTALVISQIQREVSRMLDKVKENVEASYNALLKGESASIEEIEEREDYIDYLNTEISKYIVRLMPVEMAEADSRRINNYYMIISNIERIGDHAINIAEYTQNMKKWNIAFSDNARTEIKKMKQISIKILEVIDFTDETTPASQLQAISKYESLMDEMEKKYLKRQIKRAKKGDCKAESGILFSELLTDFERIGDYALNVGELHAEM